MQIKDMDDDFYKPDVENLLFIWKPKSFNYPITFVDNLNI